jgi:hypothetical protein
MILTTLYLSIDASKSPTEPKHPDDSRMTVDYTYGFLTKSRCLCNFLEREVLRKIKFRAEGFNRIVIAMRTNPENEFVVNSSQVACVWLPFVPSEYESKDGEVLMHYYIDCLKKGLQKCAQYVSIPVDALTQGIDDFVSGGMTNQWLFKSRTFREHGLKASLLCSLTPSEFLLRIQVWRKKELVLDEEVLRTDPDEIAFQHRFRDLEIIDGALIVAAKNNTEVTWSRKLSLL